MVGLRRELSTFDLSMIAVGATIGSGIFLTPSIVAGHLPATLPFLSVWALGGLVALSGALTFAELAGALPGSGGMYVYLSRAYHPLVGFLFGWAYLLVVNTGGIAALSIAFATYLGFFIPLPDAGVPAVAITGLLCLTLLNIIGVKVGGRLADVFTLLKLAGIGGLIVGGLAGGARSMLTLESGTATFSPGAIAAAMVGVLWSYGGWQHASFTAGEARTPSRSVPLAMVAGASIVTLVYLLANLAYLSAMTPAALAATPRPAADVMTGVLGPGGGALIAAAIALSTFGSVSIYTLTAPRIYFAMAADGSFFRGVAAIHPRFRTPVTAILLQSGWAILLILFWRTFDRLISYVVFTDWIFFGLAGAAVFVLRRKLPDIARPYRTWGYPVTPLFFTGIAAWFVLNTLVQQPAQAWAGLLFLFGGIPVYFIWRRRHAKNA
jgi:APA family basic amino acid/polyamine antiporter